MIIITIRSTREGIVNKCKTHSIIYKIGTPRIITIAKVEALASNFSNNVQAARRLGRTTMHCEKSKSLASVSLEILEKNAIGGIARNTRMSRIATDHS